MIWEANINWYLVSKVTEVQWKGGGTVSPLHHIAQVGLMAALCPADVFEVVKKLPLLHQEAVGERRKGYSSFSGHSRLSFSCFKTCNYLGQTREDALVSFPGSLRPPELGIHDKLLLMFICKTRWETARTPKLFELTGPSPPNSCLLDADNLEDKLVPQSHNYIFRLPLQS